MAIDATPLFFGAAGVGRYTRTLLEHLLRRDDLPDLELIARVAGGRRPEVPGNLPLLRLRLPQKAEPWMARLGMWEKLTRADLYHATDHFLPLQDPSKCVVTVHDMMFVTHPEAQVLDTHRLQAQRVPPFLPRCRHILTVSEYTKQDVINVTGIDADRITVTPLAADPGAFTVEEDRVALTQRLAASFSVEGPYLLAVSCSTGRKNTPRLIRNFLRLHEKEPGARLVVVWDPPPEIRELAAGAGDAVRFTGRVDEAGLRDLYNGARAMIFPSLYEGFGLPVLEAMACGCPVVTANNSSLPEVGGEAVLYLQDPECDEEMLEMLERVWNGEVDLKELETKGLERSRHFSWQRTAERTHAVYHRLLKEEL